MLFIALAIAAALVAADLLEISSGRAKQRGRSERIS
jgi:hypothetical protein